MELRHLRYLEAVADCGGFSGAGRQLHVAQSAISEQLANLESEMGVSLFLRSPRKTSLTQAGQLFLEQAREILASAHYAVEIAQKAGRGEAGSLRVGFFAGATGVDFPHLIQSFRKQYPDVQLALVEMTSSRQWEALASGAIDIGFTRRLEPEFRTLLQSEVIQEDPMMAILPRGHTAAGGPVDLRDLSHEPFVLSSREISPPVFDKVIELCSEAGFSPRIASISSVWWSVVLMVQAGEGVSLLPINQQQFSMPDLAFCPLLARDAFVDFVMAWAPQRDNNLIARFRVMAQRHALQNRQRLQGKHPVQIEKAEL
jgi:DNA-binding transcriptional LysR family regulator